MYVRATLQPFSAVKRSEKIFKNRYPNYSYFIEHFDSLLLLLQQLLKLNISGSKLTATPFHARRREIYKDPVALYCHFVVIGRIFSPTIIVV
jgi:hypothetical protein